MARAAEHGSWVPHGIAAGIGILLIVCATYAFAGASRVSGFGIEARPPFHRLVLCAISMVLLSRGLLIFVPDLWRPDLSETFKFRSSVVVLVMAATFIVGTWQAWPHLSQRSH
jgi:type IV secretory pathway VirB6-like protein